MTPDWGAFSIEYYYKCSSPTVTNMEKAMMNGAED